MQKRGKNVITSYFNDKGANFFKQMKNDFVKKSPLK